MKKIRRPIQSSLDMLVPRSPNKKNRGELLVGERFVSPVAAIPTNRCSLTLGERMR